MTGDFEGEMRFAQCLCWFSRAQDGGVSALLHTIASNPRAHWLLYRWFL